MSVKKMHKLPKGAISANGFWASQDTARNSFNETNMLNVMGYNVYFWKLKEIAISRVKWNGVPSQVDERFLEETLFLKGGALISEDEVMGLMASAFTGGGERDIYNEPILRHIYTVNGYERDAYKDNSVIVWNNYNKLPDMWMVDYYAQRIYQVDRSIDINIKAQRTPIMIRATKEQQLTLKNIWMKYDGNEPVIFVEDTLDLLNGNGVSVLKTDAPYTADKMQQQKMLIVNECLTFLGIDSAALTKKEQLVSAEVRQTSAAVAANRAAFLKPRREACVKINQMFGTDLSVEWDSQADALAMAMLTVTNGGMEASISEGGAQGEDA